MASINFNSHAGMPMNSVWFKSYSSQSNGILERILSDSASVGISCKDLIVIKGERKEKVMRKFNQ